MTDEPSAQPAPATLGRRLIAEFIGTGLLVAIIVGSGVAASRLSPDDAGLQLLENSIATTLGLAVLIAIFITTSGAHFNPAVTLAGWWLNRRATPSTRFPGSHVAPYALAQITGGITGAFLANAMFNVPPGIATTERATPGTLLAEVVATAGLVLVIFSLVRTGNTRIIPITVAAYIGAAYWFTSSTSFANPAVTVGRVFSDTFAGIAPMSVLPYIGAQGAGAIIGIAVITLLHPRAAVASPNVQEAAEEQLANT